MNKSNGSSVPFLYRKKTPFSSILTCSKYFSFVEVYFRCRHKNVTGVISVTMALLYDYEKKIHPSEEQRLQLFASEIF